LKLKIHICEQWIRDLRNRRRCLIKDGNKSEHGKELNAIEEETQKWAEWREELRADDSRGKVY
jgi:hypothetical protein